MRKYLLFSVLVALFMAIAPAKAGTHASEASMASTSLSMFADTVSIPWREGFESITATDVMPYGMSMSVRTDGIINPVHTYIGVQTTPSTEISFGNIPYRNARNGSKFAEFTRFTSGTNVVNSWIFSRGLFLRAGSSYTFLFWYANSTNVNGWTVEAMAGTSPSAEGMNTKIGDSISTGIITQYQEYVGAFTPDKDGIYYFGIHAVQVARTTPVQNNNGFRNSFLSIDDLEVNFGSTPCTAVNVFARNLTNTTAELYRVYTPATANTFTVNYRKTGDENWTAQSIPANQTSVAIADLTASTRYEAKLGYTCDGTTLWCDTISFRTLTSPINPNNYPGVFPIIENFDGVTKSGNNAYMGTSGVKWYRLDSTAAASANRWYVDTLTGMSSRGKIAFISNDGGKTNAYTLTTTTFSTLLTDSMYFPKSEEFIFSFDWKAVGEGTGTSSSDYLRVFMLNPNKNVVAGSLPSTNASDIVFTGLLNNVWKTETFMYPDTLSGYARKIAFTWTNNGTGGAQPPVAIDNVIFKGLNCGTPKNLQVVDYPDDKSMLLSCATYSGDVTFDLMYRTTPAGTWNIQKGDVSGNTQMDALLLKNLSPETFYEIKVQKRCGTDTSFWSDATIGRTSIAQVVSINEDFEDGQIDGASIVNGIQKNKWIIGSAVYQGDATSGKSIYISNNGSDNVYEDTTNVVHFYYDINFAQAETFRLSFDWKGIGQAADYMRVSLVDADEVPTVGTLLSVGSRIFGKDFYGQRVWKHEKLLFSNEYAGKTKRLVFTWKNGKGNQAAQPPVAIDNLKFEVLTCSRPDLKIAGADPSSITLMTDGLESGNSFVVDYRKANLEQWSRNTVSQSGLQSKYLYAIPSLTSGTAYEIRIRRQCGADSSAFTSVVTARTTQELAQLPFSENFENQTNSSKWNTANGQFENRWAIGSALASIGTGERSAYITTGTGGENTYNTEKASTVHLYRDIHFSQGGYAYDVSFDWKGGDSNNFLSLYIADVDQIIDAGKLFPAKGILDGQQFYGSQAWKRETIRIRGDQLTNSNQTLVFTWSNTGNGGSQPPIAIDNIEIRTATCPEPNGLTWVSFPENGVVKLNFSSEANTTNFIANCYNAQEEKTTTQKTNSTNPTLTGLSSKSNYEIKINAICQGNDTSSWSAPLTVLMPQKFAQPTFNEPFEDDPSIDNWTFVNGPVGSKGNKWCFGKASYHSDNGNKALYIDSSIDGRTNICAPIASVVHAYRDIDFPESNSDYVLSFDWQSIGIQDDREWATNYFYLSLIDINKVPVYGVNPNPAVDAISSQLYSEYEGWNKANITLSKSKYSGTQKRLVFTWVNTEKTLYLRQPPATIDNVKITFPECNTPTNFTAKVLSSDSIQLTWRCLKTDTNNFTIRYQYGTEDALTKSTKDTIMKLGNLQSNTPYNLSLVNNCGGQNNTTVTLTATTLQFPASSTNFVELFDKVPSLSDWTFVNNNVNNWYTGDVTTVISESGAPSSAAYISSGADGTSNLYVYKGVDIGLSVSHIYRDIRFGNENEAVIEFDWRSVGNSSDYLKVYLADTTVTPTKNTEINIKYDTILKSSVQVPFLGSKATWQKAFLTVKGVKNMKRKLVFSWRSLETIPTNPPAAVSNVTVTAIDCSVPFNLSLQSYPSASSVVLKWDSVSTTSRIRYKRSTIGSSWDTANSNKNTVTLTDLTSTNEANILYEAQVQNNCGGKTVWAPLMYFSTRQTPATLSVDDNFDDAGDRAAWTQVNGGATNAWHIGSAVSKSGAFSAYISNDRGTSCSYSGLNPDKSLVYLYRDVEIPAGNKEFLLQFDWKGFGEFKQTLPRDFMLVYWTDENFIPQAGKTIPSASLLTNSIFYINKHDWKTANIVASLTDIPAGVRRIIFAWKNDSINGYQPPIAIDNIHADVSNCVSPNNIAIYKGQLGIDTATICWKYPIGDDKMFAINYRDKNTDDWQLATSAVADTFYTLRGLNPNTVYEVEVRAVCSGNINSFSIPSSFQTLQEPSVIDSGAVVTESFEAESSKSWTTVNGEQVNAWFFGTKPGATKGSYAAFISDSNGLAHQYFGEGLSCSHLYKTFTFPDAPEYLVTFDWKGFGSSEDYLMVSNTAATPVQGVALGQSANISDKLYGNSGSGWNSSGASIRENLKGKTRNIIFSWINDASGSNQRPAAIDNIVIKQLDCSTPTDLKLVNYPDLHSVGLKWTSDGDTFTIAYKKESAANWSYKGVRGKKTDTLTGLDSNTFYQVMVQNNCPRGKANNWVDILYSSTLSIHTLNKPISLNIVENFDSADVLSRWNIVNQPNSNQWYVGDLTGKEGQNIYISDDMGVSNNYTALSYCASHFYRDVVFPTTGTFELSFDWKLYGNTNYASLRIGLFDVTTELLYGDSIPTKNYNIVTSLAGSSTWKTNTYTLSDTLKGKRKRLIFTWRNTDNGSSYQPPAAIDNILVKSYICKSDSIFRLKSLSDSEIGLTWKIPSAESATGHVIEWRKYGTATSWNSTTVEGEETSYTLSDLDPRSYYEIKLTLQCANGIGKSVQDSMKTAYPMPFFEDFSALTTTPTDWNRKQITLSTTKIALPATEYTYSLIFGKTFVNAAGASFAAKFFTSNTTRKDWLVTPSIDLGTSKKTQLEFKLGLTKMNSSESVPDMNGVDDRLVVLMTDTTTWSSNDALMIFDNKLTDRDFNTINYTVEGAKVKIPLDGYTGSKRFAFYFESTIANSSNELFVDSVFVRPFVCDDVADLKAVYIDYDDATVKWAKKDEEQYKWEVRYGTAPSPAEMIDHEVLNENEFKLTPLDTNQIYHVFVRSICEDTIESTWQSVSFSTLALCDNMSEDSIAAIPSDVTATITWAANAGVNKSWELRYGSATATLDQMQTVYVSSPSYTINGLTEETQYAYYLRAVCVSNNDTSNWTERKTFTTLRTPCPVVSNVTVTNIRTNSATVSWDAPAGQTQWEVRYGSQGSTISAMTSNLTTAKTIALPNLTENSAYDVVVRAICRANDSSDWSARKQFSTIACGTVTGLTVAENANAISATLSWTVPNPDQIEWQVGIDTNDNLSTASVKSTTSNPYTINYAEWNINKAKDYYIAIKAKCGNTLSNSWSDYAILNKEGIDALDNTQVISINLTPNPAKDFAKLSIGGAEGQVDVQIYTVTGTLVMSEKLNCTPQSTKEFTIKGLQRGAYTIRIVHEKWTRTEKLIVQ